MKLTVENYLQTYQEISKFLSEVMANDLTNGARLVKFYTKNDDVRIGLDSLIESVNEELSKLDHPEPASPKETPVSQPKVKTVKEKPWKPTKQPKEKPAKQPKFDTAVNKVSIQVRLAARFVKLQGKNFTNETKDEARKILGALQKAILNHEIRKEGYGALSAYAAEMRKMQDKLVKMCNAPANASSIVDIAGIEDFRRIARAEGSATSVNAMRSYVRVATKPNPTKKEAETALNKIDKVIAANEQGSYKDTIAEIRDALAAFISGDTSTIATMNQTLDGIRHVCGPDCTTHKKKA